VPRRARHRGRGSTRSFPPSIDRRTAPTKGLSTSTARGLSR
jgi:hypothetical protein